MHKECGKRLRGTRRGRREAISMENDMPRYHCGSSGKIKGNVPFSVRLESPRN